MEIRDLKRKIFVARTMLRRQLDLTIGTPDEINSIKNIATANMLARTQAQLKAEEVVNEKIYPKGPIGAKRFLLPLASVKELAWVDSLDAICQSIATLTVPRVQDVARHIINMVEAPEDPQDEEDDSTKHVFFITIRIPGQDENGVFVNWKTGLVSTAQFFAEHVGNPIAIYTIQHLVFEEEYPELEICVYRAFPNEDDYEGEWSSYSLPTLNGVEYCEETDLEKLEMDFSDHCARASDNPFVWSDPQVWCYAAPRQFYKALDGSYQIFSEGDGINAYHIILTMDNLKDIVIANINDKHFVISRILGLDITEVTLDYVNEKYGKYDNKWVEPTNVPDFPYSHGETSYFAYLLIKTEAMVNIKEHMEKNKGNVMAQARQTGKSDYVTALIRTLHETVRPVMETEDDEVPEV